MNDNTPEQTPIESSISAPVGQSQHSIRLAEKHPQAIRWMHWINFPSTLNHDLERPAERIGAVLHIRSSKAGRIVQLVMPGKVVFRTMPQISAVSP